MNELSAKLVDVPHRPVSHALDERLRCGSTSTAIIHGGEICTYDRLAQAVRAVDHFFTRHGVTPGSTWGLTGSSSVELVAALAALILRGAVFVLIDPDLPPRRQRLMLALAGARGVFSTLGESGLGALTEAVALPRTREAEPEGEPDWLVHAPTPDDAAYVFFTSGTTGEPKPVFGRQKSLSHFLAWQTSTFDVHAGDRVSQLIRLSFDAILRDILLPLGVGGAICIPPDWRTNPALVLPWLRDSEVTILHTVPTLARLWLDASPATALPSLRLVFLSGEPLMSSLVEAWRSHLAPTAQVVNLYGPTETTMIKSFYVVPPTPRDGAQPIGRPLPETQIVVMSPERTVCDPEERGELVIRTPYRSLGYARVDGERLCFRPNDWSAGDWLYYTGDLGLRHEDGTLEICGRMDDQVKIHGVRVEPTEVRRVIESIAGVAQCEVAVREVGGSKRLVAYVAASGVATLDVERLRREVQQRLPEAMVPAWILAVDSLPVGPTGKVDRAKLAEIPIPSAIGSPPDEAAPGTPLEQRLARLVGDVLTLEQVGAEEDFFALGGDSLSALELMVAARRQGLELTFELLRHHPSISSLAAALAGAPGSAALEEPQPAGKADGELPLLPTQLDILALPDPASFVLTPKELSLDYELDARLVERAVRVLLERHEALRARLVKAAGAWRQDVVDPAALDCAPGQLDLSLLPEAERASTLARHVAELTRFDLGSPPLLRTLIVRNGPAPKSRLVMVLHHAIADGLSEGRLQAELVEVLERLRSGQQPPKARGGGSEVRAWADELDAAASAPDLATRLLYWSQQRAHGDDLDDAEIRPVGPPGGPLERASFALDAGTTRRALASLHAVESAQPIDLCLAATLRALVHWCGRDGGWVELVHHGRSFARVDLSEAVGCFYWVYPVRFSQREAQEGWSLAQATAQRRAAPESGLPYVIGRWLAKPAARRRALAGITPLVGVNYLGRTTPDSVDREARFHPLDAAIGDMGANLSRNPTTPLKLFFYRRGDQLAGHVWRHPRLLPGNALSALTDRLEREMAALATPHSTDLRA